MDALIGIYIAGVILSFLFEYDGDTFFEVVAYSLLWPLQFLKVLIKTFVNIIKDWKE